MEILGHIQNGVVVFDGNPILPEGAVVTVLVPASAPQVASPLPETEIVHEPGKLPYVHGGIPGTWNLTNERIAEILDEEDSVPQDTRIQLPLVRTGEPGTLNLTNDRIREIFEEEEIEALRAQWNVPS